MYKESAQTQCRNCNGGNNGGRTEPGRFKILLGFSEQVSTEVPQLIVHPTLSYYRECKVPSAWKLADVPLVPKGPIVEDFNKDLRPLSMTSTLSKVAESFIIERDLRPTLLKSMDPLQFGFVPGSCTTFALISMLHNWLEATDSTGATVRVALLDYRKAFDFVDHSLLLAKLCIALESSPQSSTG